MNEYFQRDQARRPRQHRRVREGPGEAAAASVLEAEYCGVVIRWLMRRPWCIALNCSLLSEDTELHPRVP
jgi:hypothetical protein